MLYVLRIWKFTIPQASANNPFGCYWCHQCLCQVMGIHVMGIHVMGIHMLSQWLQEVQNNSVLSVGFVHNLNHED